MGQKIDQIRTGLLCTVFALTTSCSLYTPTGAAQEAPSNPVHNYYLDDGRTADCVLIDGRGADSRGVSKAIGEMRSTLTRFPLGLAAVADLDSSRTAICYTEGAMRDQRAGVEHDAEYKHRNNLILFSGNDPGHLMHEWKHKYDGIDFDSFEMTPYHAVLTLRFAEAGAYAFEAMARHEARLNGARLPAPATGSMMDELVNIYDNTLTRGGTQEQAWRNAFDATFRYNLKDIQTSNVLSAYDQAIGIPEIRNREGFGQKTVSQNFLMQVALPPGWDAGVFARTGGDLILGDSRYVTYQPQDAERLRGIQAELDR